MHVALLSDIMKRPVAVSYLIDASVLQPIEPINRSQSPEPNNYEAGQASFYCSDERLF